MSMPLEVKGLTKTYGTRGVLVGVSLAASPGRVTGFLGPNGSGKTSGLRKRTLVSQLSAEPPTKR